MKNRKKMLLSITFTFIALAVSAQKFVVKGKLKGLEEGTKLELVEGATYKNEDPVSTAVLSGGIFELSGNTDLPKQFNVRPAGGYPILSVVVDKGDILEVDASVLKQNGGLVLQEAKYSGGKFNEIYQEKMKVRKDVEKVYNENMQKNAAISKKMGDARSAANNDLQQKIAASPEWKQLEKDEKVLFDFIAESFDKTIMDNKDSWWGPLLALNLYTYFPPGSEKLYSGLSTEAQDSYYGKILKREVSPEGLVGQIFPGFEAKDSNGQILDFKSVAAGKKYVLVDFWASWCVPCRKKIPELKSFYEKYKDKGLTIIGISVDRKEADWKKASEEERFPYLNFLDSGKTGELWNVKAIPAVFLLNSEGKIIAEEISLEEVAKLLESGS